MPLQGTFDVLDFSEILKLLARYQVTGRLHVRSRSYGANLFLDEGALVGADQSDHPAAAAAGDVRGRMEEICFELIEADRGSFEFQPGKATSLPGTTRLTVDTVLARARKRLEDWRALQERVPSLDVQPHLVADLDVNEVTFDRERWRMLTAIDGRRNLRIIGRSLNLPDFELVRLLVDLIDAGVVELDERTAAMAAASRDVVPTIPLPDSLAESVVEGHGDGTEQVTVTRRGDPDPTPSTPQADGEPAAPSDSAPAATPAEPGTPGGGSSPRGPGRRRARRRTPGGKPTSPPTPPGELPQTDGTPASGAQPGDDPGDDDDAASKRARRVVRIRSRLPKVDGAES